MIFIGNSHPSAFGALEGIWSEVTEWWYVGVGDLTRALHILAHRIVTTSSSIILGAAKFRIYIYLIPAYSGFPGILAFKTSVHLVVVPLTTLSLHYKLAATKEPAHWAFWY